MKAIIKNMAVVAVMAIFTMGLASCFITKNTTSKTSSRSNTKTTTKEVSTVLSDQEKPLTDWVKCATCSGKGTCSNCNGKGKINGRTCAACNGTGKCNICGGQGGYRAE